MIKTSLKLTVVFVTLTICLCINLNAQEDHYIYPIYESDGNYQGPGIQWILQGADSVQFLMFGEQHGVEGIAELVEFMYRELHQKAFRYLVLESDGWTTQKAAELGVIAFSQKNPHSIAFDTNGDLKLMQSAIELNPSIQTPIWGVDQMQTAIHPYARLVELARTSRERTTARGAYLKATLKMGRYTRQDHQEDLNALEIIFNSNDSAEKDQIIKELRQTIDIFYRWMDPATRNASVRTRELLMGSNFDSYRMKAPEAKAIFKMGGAHTMYGMGPNGVLTFGDHVRNIALEKGQSTLSISIHRYNPERSIINPSAFAEAPMILIDSKQAQLMYPEVKRFSQVDATILLKEAGYANKNTNRAYESAFRNRFIREVLPLGICLIILLMIIIQFLIQLIRSKPSLLKVPAIASTIAIVLVGYQILQILHETSSAAISSGFFPTMLHLLFALVTMFFLYRCIILMKEKTNGRISYLIFTVGFMGISYLIYYWNIGGMLG